MKQNLLLKPREFIFGEKNRFYWWRHLWWRHQLGTKN